MKTLFLVWYRGGRPQDGPFRFQPYLYGPCAFDLYAALEEMRRDGLIAQAAHPVSRLGRYFLTERGRNEASNMTLDADIRRTIAETAQWAAQQSFRSLLDEVYGEAPEYAAQTVLREQAV